SVCAFPRWTTAACTRYPGGHATTKGDYVPGALDGLRVIEISRGIAASYCGKLLADYGAEVLKLEPPDGDPVRALGPFRADRPTRRGGGLFLYLNTNKRSLTLNLKTATGRRIL